MLFRSLKYDKSYPCGVGTGGEKENNAQKKPLFCVLVGKAVLGRRYCIYRIYIHVGMLGYVEYTVSMAVISFSDRYINTDISHYVPTH